MGKGILINITKTFLYLSSFFPLFVLLVIQNIEIISNSDLLSISAFFSQFFEKKWYAPESIFWFSVILFLIASVISIVMFFFFYLNAEGASGKLVGENFERTDTLGYIITYIVPLLSMNIASYRSLIVNFVLFIIIGVFYIKNNQFFMNPVFNLMGYNILASDSGHVYVTKLSPRKMKIIAKEQTEISLKNIAEDIYVVKLLK